MLPPVSASIIVINKGAIVDDLPLDQEFLTLISRRLFSKRLGKNKGKHFDTIKRNSHITLFMGFEPEPQDLYATD